MVIKIFLRSTFFCLIFFLSGFAYFQQEVGYNIQVKLVPSLNRLEGYEKIIYHNNSPDTLTFLYFHLYMNRFKKDFSYDGIQKENEGYIEVVSFQNSQNEELEFLVDQTVLKVMLNRTILPGDTQIFKIRFNTILPPAKDRLGYYGDHYDVGNWYPVPAVYDQFDWHADQHINGEFYQEWGNYQVDITVPRGFVVAASGSLQNPEVLPDSVSESNRSAKSKYWSEENTVTFKFVAPRIHDFAWSADPEFVLKKSLVNDVTLQFYILSFRMPDWEPQVEKANQAFRYFEKVIGKYPYSSLSIVDGYITAGGIEYPNLVIINDNIYDPRDLSATIIHEMAHQWFYGLLANNQTRYGWMDEGFATYFENLGMEKVYGTSRDYLHSPIGIWGNWLGYEEDFWQRDFLLYYRYSRSGKSEPINTHFDWFQNDPYIPYYQKMSLVISQLRLVLGDSIFWKGIRLYFDTWKFRHPYPEDLYSSFEQVSGLKLGWFFDEWLNTTRECDYAVDGLKQDFVTNNGNNKYQATIQFKRNLPIAMPLDFRVHLKNGLFLDYRIPLGDGQNFQNLKKSTISPWSFDRKVNTVQLHLPAKIKYVEIDPEHRLLDMNPFNNDSRFFPQIYFYFMHRQYLYPRTDGYTTTVFPHLFYNQIDGLQLGIRTRGNFVYPEYQHRLTLLLGTRSFHPDLDFWFEHPLYFLNNDIHVVTNFYNSSGRRGIGSWLEYTLNRDSGEFQTVSGWQFRRIYDSNYLSYPETPGNLSFLNFLVQYSKWNRGYLPLGYEVKSNAEISFLGSAFDYQSWDIAGTWRLPVIKSQKITLSIGTGGQYGNLPIQKLHRPGGDNSYAFFDNPYFRAKGTLPLEWWRNGHLFQSGGGNLRSLAYDWQNYGEHFIAGQIAVTLGNPLNLSTFYIPYLSDINLSVYSSTSSWSDNWGDFNTYLTEAGLTLSLTRLPFLFYFFDIEELHFDFPFWVNDNIDQNNFDFRWVLRMDIRSFY
jgi:hypothetical protein